MATTIQGAIRWLKSPGQIAYGKFTLKSRMLQLIDAISDSSYNRRNVCTGLVFQSDLCYISTVTSFITDAPIILICCTYWW